jgi:CTP synthase
MDKKIIFVTGGVLSSLGKGIASASIGVLLKKSNLKVSMLKIDPYINIDPGTMSPIEHGEVFVTSDGAETDLDLGNYERFLNTQMLKINNFTTGQVYQQVIDKERAGEYLGQTIQVIPHIVDEIKSRILQALDGFDILIVELGGTVGDIESMPYLEAIRGINTDFGRDNVMNIHVTLVPYIKTSSEFKTKPTQHSIQELRRTGVNPNMIFCRSEQSLPIEIKRKLSSSCGVDIDSVIGVEDASSIYQVPLNLLKQDVLISVAKHLRLDDIKPNIDEWDNLVKKITSPRNEITIAFVGKYMALKESYKSLIESFIHTGANLDTQVKIKWINSEDLDSKDVSVLKNCDGILVAGGFGNRGVEGKIEAIKYARENNVPFLGICLGMQLAVLEFAQNVLGIKDANSVEFDENTKEPIVYLINQFLDASGNTQIRTTNTPKGGTMRLGSFKCNLKDNTKIQKAYSKDIIIERHRHRYEINPKYIDRLEEKGLIISGEFDGLVDAVELENHPWFVGVQFHPEFTSNLEKPNPIITEFIKYSILHK